MRDTTLMQQNGHLQHLHTLPGDASVLEAATVMTKAGVGAVLITSSGKARGRLVGIFTERDLMARVVCAQRDAATTPLRAVMTPNPDTLPSSARVSQAMAMMEERHYRHMPIVDNGRLVGIVSVRDLHVLVRHELEDDAREYQEFVFGTGYSVPSTVLEGHA